METYVQRFSTEFTVIDRNTVDATRKIAANAKQAGQEMRALRLQTEQMRLAQQQFRAEASRATASTRQRRESTAQLREQEASLRIQQRILRLQEQQRRANQPSKPKPLLSVSGGVAGGPDGLMGFLQFGGRLGPALAVVAMALQAATQAAAQLLDIVGKVVVSLAQLTVQGTVALFTLGARFDGLERGLAAVSGGAQAARDRIKELREVAKLPGLNLEQAISGDTRLQAAGVNPALSRRMQIAFGNAVATVGGGPEEMKGVLLAITQIAAKGKVFAEEINQINERVPQIRKAMRDAFGTSNTEILGKMGIGASEFLGRITTELEKLPRVTGGATNALENLKDSVVIALLPAARGVARIFESIAPVLENLVARVSPFLERIGRVLDAVATSGLGATALKNAADSLMAILGLNNLPGTQQIITAVSMLLAAIENLPAAGKLFADTVIAATQGLMATIQFMVHSFNAVALLAIRPDMAIAAQQAIPGDLQRQFAAQQRLNDLENSWMGLKEKYRGDVDMYRIPLTRATAQQGATTPGMPQLQSTAALEAMVNAQFDARTAAPALSASSPVARIMEATERTAFATERQLELSSQVIGGGSLAQSGIPIVDIFGKRGDGGGANQGLRVQVDGEDTLRRFVQDIAEQVAQGLAGRGAFNIASY